MYRDQDRVPSHGHQSSKDSYNSSSRSDRKGNSSTSSNSNSHDYDYDYDRKSSSSSSSYYDGRRGGNGRRPYSSSYNNNKYNRSPRYSNSSYDRKSSSSYKSYSSSSSNYDNHKSSSSSASTSAYCKWKDRNNGSSYSGFNNQQRVCRTPASELTPSYRSPYYASSSASTPTQYPFCPPLGKHPSSSSYSPCSSRVSSIEHGNDSYFNTPQYYDPTQTPGFVPSTPMMPPTPIQMMPPTPQINTLHHPVNYNERFYDHPSANPNPNSYRYPPCPVNSNNHYPSHPGQQQQQQYQDAKPPPCKIPKKTDKNEELIESLVNHVKANGVYDIIRKMCMTDIEIKETYRNLNDKVNSTVEHILKDLAWSTELNPNQIRGKIKSTILDAKYFQTGLDAVVDDIVNKEADPQYCPLIDESVQKFLGAKKEKEMKEKEKERIEKEKIAEAERIELEKLNDHKRKVQEQLDLKAELDRKRAEKEAAEKEAAEKAAIEKAVAEKEEAERQASLRLRAQKLSSYTPSESEVVSRKHLSERTAMLKLKVKGENGIIYNENLSINDIDMPEEQNDEGSDEMEYEYESSSEEDESPMFEPIQQASPPRVTREEIEEKFSLEMQEELRRLAALQVHHVKSQPGDILDELTPPKDAVICRYLVPLDSVLQKRSFYKKFADQVLTSP